MMRLFPVKKIVSLSPPSALIDRPLPKSKVPHVHRVSSYKIYSELAALLPTTFNFICGRQPKFNFRGPVMPSEKSSFAFQGPEPEAAQTKGLCTGRHTTSDAGSRASFEDVISSSIHEVYRGAANGLQVRDLRPKRKTASCGVVNPAGAI